MSRIIFGTTIIAAHLCAQETTIQTTVPLVQVPVSVTDKAGHFVYGLTTNDFVVSDQGQEVPVHVDDPDTVSAPLAVVVLVQTTDISQSAILKIKKIGSILSQAIVGAHGLAAVITYSDQVIVVQRFSDDADTLSNVIQNLKSVPTRGGHMLDALGRAVQLLGVRPSGARPAVVIIGESKDRGSKTTLAEILPGLQKSGATVYCIEYSAYLTPFTTKATEYSPPEGGGWILDSITEIAHAMKQDTAKIVTTSTGGRTLKFETKAKLEKDLIRLGEEIHSRYMLSFAPVPSDGESFHAIAVRVRDRPDLIIHARPGYWSSMQ